MVERAEYGESETRTRLRENGVCQGPKEDEVGSHKEGEGDSEGPVRSREKRESGGGTGGVDTGQIASGLTGRDKMCARNQSHLYSHIPNIGVHTQPCMYVVSIATCHLYMCINIHENVYRGISIQLLDNTLSYALKHTHAHSHAPVDPFI